MGFTGRVVLAKGDDWAGAGQELSREEFDGGWVAVSFAGDPGLPLKALVERTGAPALSAMVVDSDCADVTAATPGGLDWRAYLHETIALGYGAPEIERPAESSVAAWAAEAGLAPERAAIAEALDARETFVEDTLHALFGALGLNAKSE